MIAHLALLDPATLTDNAGYDAGKSDLPLTEIPYVLVNGELVLRESKMQGKIATGQPIRIEHDKRALE